MINSIGYFLFWIIYIFLPAEFFLIILFLGTVILLNILNKNYKKILIIIITTVFLVLLVFQTDFIKSRKQVDEAWMIGKTEFIVKIRYSDTFNGKINQGENIKVKDKEYHFCVREIFKWDSFDDIIYGELYYYVHTNNDGIITDVVCYQRGGDAPYSEYRYSDRW